MARSTGARVAIAADAASLYVQAVLMTAQDSVRLLRVQLRRARATHVIHQAVIEREAEMGESAQVLPFVNPIRAVAEVATARWGVLSDVDIAVDGRDVTWRRPRSLP